VTWTDFYLICFLVGLGFSLLPLVAGSFHLHLPHIHLHFGHAHAPRGGHADALNFGTIAAFLAWFGGAGYLLSRYGVLSLLAFGLAVLSGIAGASVLFLFLAKILVHKDEVLNPADYEMVGVLGLISSGIRPSGTGEIIFSQAGTRRAAPARSENGLVIPKGSEVVVTRYERGIAYVRPWDELTEGRAKEAL